ncbi:MAG: hypothetical protein ACHP7O_04850 [Burkholderiales bacterium]
MQEDRIPKEGQKDIALADEAKLRFATLLYRFLFFDWLFVDMTKAKNLFERNAAWQHNRAMRMHLPLYLRRWSVLTGLDLGLGCVFEKLLEIQLAAAWFFTWSCVTVTGMVVIAALWALLSIREMS